MKRFYCTECKKIKRVQHLPRNTSNATSVNPQDRIGKCNHHENKWTRALEKQAEGRFNRVGNLVTSIGSN